MLGKNNKDNLLTTLSYFNCCDNKIVMKSRVGIDKPVIPLGILAKFTLLNYFTLLRYKSLSVTIAHHNREL